MENAQTTKRKLFTYFNLICVLIIATEVVLYIGGLEFIKKYFALTVGISIGISTIFFSRELYELSPMQKYIKYKESKLSPFIGSAIIILSLVIFLRN